MSHTGIKHKWDKNADVVIVGSGLAGLAAAIESAQSGCSVVVLEKMKGYGGNSTISDGAMAAAGSDMQIKADKAVILAAGGFGNDIAFRSAHDPRLDQTIDSTNKYSATGGALREAMRIGAMPVHLSWIQLGPWACPDEKGYGVGPDFSSYIAFPYGIIVDPTTGHRFINEMADRKIRADAIMALGHPCICVADHQALAVSGHDISRALKKGVVKEFDHLQELAIAFNMPPNEFKETVAQFNDHIKNGSDPEYGKPVLSDAAPLEYPPFYAMRLWPKVHYTMGGILINLKAQVLDLKGRPIQRFFAAGEVTGGVHGASRLGCCAITDCLVFGRIAGQEAAKI